MSSWRVVIVQVLTLWGFIHALELPPYMHRCRLKDPNFNECVKESANFAIPFMKNGSRTYHLPGIDPLIVERIATEPSRNFKIELADVKSYGFEKCVVKNVSANMEKNTSFFHFFIPRWELISRYQIDGNILILPIHGRGDCNITLIDTDLFYNMNFEIKPGKGGKDYIQIVDSNVYLTTKRIYSRLDNLFNGNKAIGDEVNKVLNREWKIFHDELSPTISETVAQIATSTFNGLFSTVPYENVFILD